MKFKTKISKITENDVIIRDKNLSDLVKNSSFSDTIFLLIKGKLPSEKESKLFSSILTSSIDHGIGTSSSLATRTVMSTTHQINTAVGAGISALGKFHGGAIESSMKQIKEIVDNNKDIEEYVKEKITNKEIIYGFGHKIHKESDPRVLQLIKITKELNLEGIHLNTAIDLEKEIEKQKGRKLILNIDGFIAASLLDLGFLPEQGNGVFIIARTPGLVAQAIEERLEEKPVRRVSEEDIEFID